MGLDKCTLIDFPRIEDPRGNLTFIEGTRHVPFEIKSVYYLYDVPGGAARGGHAHKTLQQLLIAMSGSFDVTLDDGRDAAASTSTARTSASTSRPMIWRDIDNFSSGSVCMALASDYYSEDDYYRDYDEFLERREGPARDAGSLPRPARRLRRAAAASSTRPTGASCDSGWYVLGDEVEGFEREWAAYCGVEALHRRRQRARRAVT